MPWIDVDSFEIRALTEEEQALFGGTEGDSTPEFSDDFSDVDASTAQWSLLGDQSKMHINEGSLSFDASDNVKAVAGSNTWTDYVVESEITLGQGGSNAGLMFRVVDAQENGTDSYRGYYCGIGTSGVTIGYGNNGWKQLDFISRSITANEPHTLKVVVCADKIAIYLDDEFITNFRDTRYAAGMIGFRGFNQAFSVSNVTVRPYDEATDGGAFEGIGEYQISDTYSSWEAIQFKFEAVGGADDYKIVYGTESGVYTGAVYELVVPWSTQYVKAGISGLENGQTYYLRLIAMQGGKELLTSEEVVVTAGERLDISDQLAELAADLEASQAISTEGCSAESVNRLNWAIENAAATLNNAGADMIDVSMARRSLKIGAGELEESTEPAPNQYTITVTQSTGGTIAPATVQVDEGTDKTFTITANEGYVVKDVLVDGQSVGAVTSYTFRKVTEDHTIAAVYEKTDSTAYDLNGDQTINLLDIVAAMKFYQVDIASDPAAQVADVNRDGTVTIEDLLLIAVHFTAG